VSDPSKRMKLFNDYLYSHTIGNDKCESGWCDGGHSYPVRCKCGGLIHANFGDEYPDGDYFFDRLCDKCGEDYEFE
jgi:hypothetical protein